MSISGDITWFTASQPPDPRASLLRALHLLNTDRADLLLRTPRAARSARWLPATIPLRSAPRVPPSAPAERLGSNVPINAIPLHYRDDACLHVHICGRAFLARLQKAIETALPPSIRGDFSLSTALVRAGPHDILEGADIHDEPIPPTAFFSFTLFGYGSARDSADFRQRVFDIPQLRSVEEDLGAILGQPLQRCVSWSV